MVHIIGDITRLCFENVIQLVEIFQWGSLRLYSCQSMFMNCKNLKITATDIPNLIFATDLSEMFYGCISLNSDLSKWNVENVNNMNFMFYNCISFNSNLSEWNVKNVTNMNVF